MYGSSSGRTSSSTRVVVLVVGGLAVIVFLAAAQGSLFTHGSGAVVLITAVGTATFVPLPAAATGVARPGGGRLPAALNAASSAASHAKRVCAANAADLVDEFDCLFLLLELQRVR